MSVTALTSAEIPLPAAADGQRVSDRIAVPADTVEDVFPLGAEAATREVAAEFRVARGINSRRR